MRDCAGCVTRLLRAADGAFSGVLSWFSCSSVVAVLWSCNIVWPRNSTGLMPL